MADNGIRAITPILQKITTTSAVVLDTVPANKERTYLFLRCTNAHTADLNINITVRPTSGGADTYISFNTVIPVGAPQNALGPDILGPLPAGTTITASLVTANATGVHVVLTGTERDI